VVVLETSPAMSTFGGDLARSCRLALSSPDETLFSCKLRSNLGFDSYWLFKPLKCIEFTKKV
jgi:hypothetical protein